MLTKNDFVKNIFALTENVDKLYTYYNTSLKVNKGIFTNEFYEVSVCNSIQKFLGNDSVNVMFYGFSDNAEKKMICFSKSSIDVSDFDNVAKVLKISYNDKFNKLSHRDFLGSIMSLGITRYKLGDLVLKDNFAYVPVIEKFSDSIIDNLKKVRNVCVKTELGLFNKLPEKNIEILYKIVSSLRLDSIVSVLINISREKSKVIIRDGKVKINGISQDNIDYKIHENDFVTVSGFGKFKIRESLGNTSKNKIKIIVDKFI